MRCTVYRAFLDCLADGQTHRSKEVKDTVAGACPVSEKERAEMLVKRPLLVGDDLVLVGFKEPEWTERLKLK